MHFEDFFPLPSAALVKIFQKNWPQKSLGNTPLLDKQTGSALLTGFSAASRRYNNMFTLAAHETQSTAAEKELHCGNHLRPSNIRIHGTMYRRVFSAAETTPLRYLVVDPAERARQGKQHGLDATILRHLEQELLPHNPHMLHIRAALPGRKRSQEATLALRWDEGINEVAAVVQHEPAAQSRAVLFHMSAQSRPQYLHPLNALYEPLSYPLWFPRGGRGWSPGTVLRNGHVVSQMWWYRQQLLRLPHMHMCGRLLNEWLINMYCRMEDERLSLIRREQSSRVASRRELCESLRNEVPSSAVGKISYLPSSVPGSPRHLRRLRADALELARRKGPPTFFITLTCNPYWPEIQAALLPGQTAADRPDVVVRVFHERLEKMMAFLRDGFCGKRRYVVRVIEYQRRGLPHAHVALACDTPPLTPEAVDAIISCEVPQAPGPLRDLVLRHMLHSCNNSCHPDDPQQECAKGCPWPFRDDTDFDVQGCPHHRRRPCDSTCPNCVEKRAAFGKRSVCCNRLVVEYAAAILTRWQGHANVKFAGSVNLFEYLYKYLFKGPDFACYSVTFDGQPVDEIADWLRGRYLCATEAAWRLFGYTTYERVPQVVCLPVHLESEDWVHYNEGTEAQALVTSISPLLRYFYRPRCLPFTALKYHEYFEHFSVSKNCPKTLQGRFPLLFQSSDDASHPEQRLLLDMPGSPYCGMLVQPCLDTAPDGQQHFVYLKLIPCAAWR